MNVRNVQSRITKLEARRTRPDEMLVVWRPPDGDVAQALKDATFARGDKVICSEWFDNRPPPKPRWYSDQLRWAMPPEEYQQINRTVDRVADNPQAKRDPSFAPFPSITEDRVQRMTTTN